MGALFLIQPRIFNRECREFRQVGCRGQVLLYPYYTTRADSAGNAYATLLSVINDNASTKAVPVRFLEGRNSREVLDFNLYLSLYDAWTANIFALSDAGRR